jgi:hypothetical protein
MTSLTERYTAQIARVLSCFDRIVITGTLPGVCFAEGMTNYPRQHGIRLFDYPRFAEPPREEIRGNAERIARENGLGIQFIRSVHAFRKEDRIRAILQQRGNQPGLVHILSAMEPCPALTPWYDKATGKTTPRYKDGRCLRYYYFYLLDPELGLRYTRVPTWAPFRPRFYRDGHNHLAGQLRQAGIPLAQLDNTFTTIADFSKTQALADGFPIERLHHALDGFAA